MTQNYFVYFSCNTSGKVSMSSWWALSVHVYRDPGCQKVCHVQHVASTFALEVARFAVCSRGKRAERCTRYKVSTSLVWPWHTSFPLTSHCLALSHTVTPNSKESWERMPNWGPRTARFYRSARILGGEECKNLGGELEDPETCAFLNLM